MKTLRLLLLFVLLSSVCSAECINERLEYERAQSAYSKVVHRLWPKIKAGKKLTKKESRELDRANAREYNAKFAYEACANGSGDGNNFGGVDY